MFCAGNAKKKVNTDKNIINANKYLNKVNLAQNKNLTDQKNSNIKLLNLNTVEFLKDFFANIYEKTN